MSGTSTFACLEPRRADLAALERESRLASFDWSVLTEEAFTERYSG